ncbi:MAG: DUF3185 domain-containing protein [Candidatus Eisenbacteria bacterium]
MARTVGLLLLVVGLIGLAWGGFTYAEKRHHVDLGPMDISVTEHKTVPIPPIAGAVAIVAGLVLLSAGASRSKGVQQ